MICSNCATENKPGRKFCVACATPLAAACPSCGAPFDPGDAFCGECGTPLGGSQATTRDGRGREQRHRGPGRRRRPPAARSPSGGSSSVLFADLVGFTPFAEERDAEDVRDTLTRYFEIASRGHRPLRRHGREVHRRRGDGGVGRADRPRGRRRASRPGRPRPGRRGARSWAPTIQARAGVLTGEAAVTLGATNQGMVAGDLVNTAARLQSVAQPGTVLVGEATMRAAERGDRLRGGRRAGAQGQDRPRSPAYRALRVVAQRGGQGRSDLPEPPFVGPRRGAPPAQGPDRDDRPGPPRRGSSRSPGRPGSARAASPGSSRSTSTGSARRSTGTAAARPPTARGSRSGRSARWSAAGLRLAEDDDEATTRERDRRRRSPSSSPTRRIGAGSKPALLTLLGLAARAGRRAGRPVRGLADLLRADRRAGHDRPPVRGPPVGRHAACSTSSSTSSSGRRTCRSSSSPSPGRSCSTAVRTGAPRRAT